MPRGKRTNVSLRCQTCESPQDQYVMRLNRKEGAIKAFLRKKFCSECRKHTDFKAKEIKGGY